MMNNFYINKNNVGLKYTVKWGGRDNTIIPKMAGEGGGNPDGYGGGGTGVQLPFKINIETEGGKELSYYTGSFARSDEINVSASFVLYRMNYLKSSSYNHGIIEPDTTMSGPVYFKDSSNIWLSASGDFPTSDSKNTGSLSIYHTETEDTSDRLKRYRFYGTKVCNVLGLPAGQWIYPSNFQLADTVGGVNYFAGDINAKKISVSHNISFSPLSSVTSNIRFDIISGSTDLFLQFTSGSAAKQTNQLLIGYDTSDHKYKISGSIGNSIDNPDQFISFTSASFDNIENHGTKGFPFVFKTGFNTTANSEVWMPWGFAPDEATAAYSGEYHQFIAPYNGYIERVLLRQDMAPQIYGAGVVTVGFYKASDGSSTSHPSLGSPDDSETVTMGNGFPYTFEFDREYGGNASFTAGTSIGLSFNPTYDVGTYDIWGTIVIRMLIDS